MNITPIADRFFRVVRSTAILVERAEISASHTTHTSVPTSRAYVEIALWGTELTGEITIRGVVDGSEVTEVLTAMGPIAVSAAVLRSCNLWDYVLEITTDMSDEAPGTELQARYVGSGNEPIQAMTELSDCVPGMRDARGSGIGWPTRTEGSDAQESSIIGHDDLFGFEPRVGDYYVEQRVNADGDGLQDWKIFQVVARPDYLGTSRPETWELRVELREDAPIGITTATEP